MMRTVPSSIFAALLFLAIGLGLLTGAWFAYDYVVVRPQSWPRADAVVVSSRVVNPKNPSQHQPEVVFRVEQEGRTRDVTITASWSSSSYDSVRAYLDRFPTGAQVPVAINPQDASDIRYELGASLINLLLPGILGTLGLIFTVVGLVTMRPHTPARPSAAQNALAARRVAIVFTAIGAVLLGIGIWLFSRDAAMLGEWPTVDAEVTDVAIVTSSSSSTRGPSRPLYDVQVTFAYQVTGKRFESKTTTGMASSSRDRAAGLLKQYAKGSHHPIRHRPDDPNVIRFDVSRLSVFASAGGLALMGLVFLGFGMLFLNKGPKPERGQSPFRRGTVPLSKSASWALLSDTHEEPPDADAPPAAAGRRRNRIHGRARRRRGPAAR
jgi:hypothetical protein